ncbi:putative fasciclin-like arabinogalactan protein 20 [Abeliophyllum distichum]|uniref:Fasciclin-like arabinogalactan protein 20 n=1 Tax=Abeliophyllum distichum TaxID=126358 RepID=A0ABD1V7L6_9LAMI
MLLKSEVVELVRKYERERARMNENLIALLLKLDSIPGIDSGVRDCRKAVIRRSIALQERIDAIALVNLENTDVCEVSEALKEHVDQTLEIMIFAEDDSSDGMKDLVENKSDKFEDSEELEGSDSHCNACCGFLFVRSNEFALALALICLLFFHPDQGRKIQAHAESDSDAPVDPPKVEEKIGAVPSGLSTHSDDTKRRDDLRVGFAGEFSENVKLTVFAPVDEELVQFSGDFMAYSSLFMRHLVPCKVGWNELNQMGNGTVLPNNAEGFNLEITRNEDGGGVNGERD